MTQYEAFYRRLILLDTPLRQQWLLDNQPASVSPAHWWLALIDSAVADVRYQYRGWAAERPRADLALAASLVEWALNEAFPLEIAVERLTEITHLALEAGQQVHQLPRIVQPDAIVRRMLTGFALTPEEATARAASLRATPNIEEDLARPDEDWVAWRALMTTVEYRDYHQLLNIDRMLTAVTPLIDVIADADLAIQLRTWLAVRAELHPLPHADTINVNKPVPSAEQTA